MSRPRPIPDSPPPDATAGLGFLLSQVGAHTSARFATRLEPLGFKPMHAGILGVIQQSDGLSQQALGEKLGMFSSRLVGVIDEMEKRGLVERRDSPKDRRSYALHLTDAGRNALKQIGLVMREHQEDVCASLGDVEKAQLADFLRRIAAEQGLLPGIHPGFGNMDRDKKV